MNPTGNTILITGGGSGIGRALAEALHAQGNQIVIAGRRRAALEEVTQANKGMQFLTLDIENGEDFQRFVVDVKNEYPTLNVLINNAGIMKSEDLKTGLDDLPIAESTIATNLLGPLRLTAALMPVLLAQPKATIAAVTSGLAFVPLAMTPTYCATKAALHSWLQSLRRQLVDTSVEVLEIVPPYVQTELMGAHQANDPNAMPLADYITETMNLLNNPPVNGELLVERVKPLRFAEKNGNYDQTITMLNSRH